MAQLPVAHAHILLPDMVTSGHVTDVTSGHVTDVTSGHMTDVTSGHVTSGHVTSGHAQWSDPPHDPPQMRLFRYPYTTYMYP